jgi:catechol 2,3-dioxygenase-like lactoylglutathione lyase family enzyme
MAMFSGARMVTLIPTRNLNRAIAFYTKKLGGKVKMRARGPMRDYWASLALGTTEVWLVAPSKIEKRKLAYEAFLVKNIRTAVAGLQRKGVRFHRGETETPDGRVEGPIAFESFGASAYFSDPDGNLLMLWQNFPPM